MKVVIGKTEKKRLYAFKTITLKSTGLKDYVFDHVWNYGPDARIDMKGNITLRVKKLLK
jgi:hypothetical protein